MRRKKIISTQSLSIASEEPLIDGRKNNFDLIRLIAAIQVVYFHGAKHLGVSFDSSVMDLLNAYFIAFPGVVVFFVISGFLIAKSYDRGRNLYKFVQNRILRIYPALWIGFLVTLTALVTSGAIIVHNLLECSFYLWIVGQLTFFQYYTPAFLRPYGVGNPNGSLWTIPVELEFYACIPVLFFVLDKFPVRSHKNIFLLVLSSISIFFYQMFYLGEEANVFQKLLFVSLLPHLWIFLLGVFAYVNFEFIRPAFEGKALYWGIIFVLTVWISRYCPLFRPHSVSANVVIACLTLSIAFSARWVSARILNQYDISYGVYIFHMIIANIMIHYGFIGEKRHLLALMVLTCFVGLLSWLIVEKKVLRLKHKNLFCYINRLHLKDGDKVFE